VEDGDPVAPIPVLEHVQDVLQGGVAPLHHLAQARRARLLQDLVDALRLLGKAAEVAALVSGRWRTPGK
jgi:thiamine monophosphate synthase